MRLELTGHSFPGIAIESVSGRDTIVDAVERHRTTAAWAVADVFLGVWQPHSIRAQFESQIRAQMEVAECAIAQPELPGLADGHADIISSGVDAEARGNWPALLAVDGAMRLGCAARSGGGATFFVIAPRDASDWEPEEALFLRRLSTELDQSGRVVLLQSASETTASEGDPDPGDGQADDMAALIPGIIDADWGTTLLDGPDRERAMSLPGGHYLLFPEDRPSTLNGRTLQFDRLAEMMSHVALVAAYAQRHGSNYFVDASVLASEAWRCFNAGSPGLATRLLEHAVMVANGLEQGVLLAQLQGMRIASEDFASAGACESAGPHLPARLRSFLLQSKGWGMVLSGEPQRGCAYLEQAQALLPASDASREAHYLQNILALGQMRSGDVDAALDSERDILRASGAAVNGTGGRPRDHRLEYINAINIARLHRRRGELEDAEAWYGRAFATTDGARSESDAIHAHVVFAQLNTQLKRHAQAEYHWLMAATMWAAGDAPEAIGRRVLRAIAPGLDPRAASLVDATASAFCGALASFGGHHAVADKADVNAIAPLFVRSDRLPSTVRPGTCLAARGWCVFGSDAAVFEPHRTPAHRRLRAMIASRMHAALSRTLPGLRTWIVDDGMGAGIPSDSGAMLMACVRLQVRRLEVEGRCLQLAPAMLAEIERATTVVMSPAVDRVVDSTNGATSVSYRRYRNQRLLTAEEAALVKRIIASSRDSGEAILASSVAPGLARRLERDRIVRFTISEGACEKVGIRFSSSVTLSKA